MVPVRVTVAVAAGDVAVGVGPKVGVQLGVGDAVGGSG